MNNQDQDPNKVLIQENKENEYNKNLENQKEDKYMEEDHIKINNRKDQVQLQR